MKISPVVLILAAASSTANALVPPTTDAAAGSRRAFISKVSTAGAGAAAAAAVTLTTPSAPAVAAGDYSLDTGDVVVPKKEKAEKTENGGAGLVGAALGGSVLLSLPFFLPNLMRLAGINNAKNPNLK